MNNITALTIHWTENGLVPDSFIRAGIRRLLRQRLAEIHSDNTEAASVQTEMFVASLLHAPVALVPEKANDQHYEVPAEFYSHALGQHRKYSSCYWPEHVASLDEAEAAALKITCDRAGLADGMDILELGCGWGSLTLWMAEHFPQSLITGVSNSHSQRQYILNEAARRGLCNIDIVTADMNHFTTERRFDRIVSVEMFEHMRNWQKLFSRVHDWLKPGGRFFMHVFVHRSVPYAFEVRNDSDWMSEHFFSGGMMPSDDLPLRFQERLKFLQRWRWDGRHYEKTANAWLVNIDTQREQALKVLARTYGADTAAQWLQRWRIFFMACAELFGHNHGQEWWVSHYLFERPQG
ncbi:MAG: cyclopropane-fatty-acyl-phospholipid synthase family protein [Gammaproteobacteria bacterium]|nr:cyclopropane-fatty-acyl-phospholipid synthase family protein [Gammaproteobacteria bacterium]